MVNILPLYERTTQTFLGTKKFTLLIKKDSVGTWNSFIRRWYSILSCSSFSQWKIERSALFYSHFLYVCCKYFNELSTRDNWQDKAGQSIIFFAFLLFIRPSACCRPCFRRSTAKEAKSQGTTHHSTDIRICRISRPCLVQTWDEINVDSSSMCSRCLYVVGSWIYKFQFMCLREWFASRLGGA